jgi:predicted secreted Zn-dependent protease
MVLSTRRAVLLVALVGVLALGIMGVLGGVSASPDNADDHNGSEGPSTLTVLAKTPEIKVADLGPKGPSHGDLRAINAPVYNESGKEKVGRIDGFCTITDPADESAEKVHMAECTYTYTLPGGEISVQGVNAYPKLSEPSPRSVDAITGGTGNYAGVRGERRFETHGTKVIITFHFIG